MPDHVTTGSTEIIVLTDSESDDEDDITLRHTPMEDPYHPDDFYDFDADWAFAFNDPEVNFPDPEPAFSPMPEVFAEQQCLQKVLDIFPDIAHDYVLKLFKDGSQEGITGSAWCDRLIVQILDSGAYPKERDRRQELKRKRRDSQEEDGIAEFEKADRENAGHAYFLQA